MCIKKIIFIRITDVLTIEDPTRSIIDVSPKTEPILNIFDPIKFPIEIPFSFFKK